MGIVANSGIRNLSGLPAWVPSTSGTWTEVTGTRPDTAMANRAMVNAWISYVVKPSTSEVFEVAAGGHDDYAGNEVRKLSLNQASPAWSQEKADNWNGIESCISTYASGDPCSRHTYYGVTYDPINDRVMLFGGAPYCPAGGTHVAVSSYNIIAKTYNSSGTHPSMLSDFNTPGFACTFDPATGDVYPHYVHISKWTRSTNTWNNALSTTGEPAQAQNEVSSAFDSSRGRVFLLGGGGSAHHLYSTGGDSWSSPTLTGARSAELATITQEAMVYIPAIDKYLVRLHPAGNDVIQIDASSFACTTFPNLTGGTAIQNAQPYTSPANDGAGPFNKFLYVPNLRGCIYIQGYDLNCYFLRVH